MRLFNELLLLACMSLLFSCGKSNDNANGSKLKKIVETNLNQETNFIYEDGVMVSSRKTAQHQSGEYKYFYMSDRLYEIQVQETRHTAAGDFNEKYKVKIIYENENRLSKISYHYEDPFVPGNYYIGWFEFTYAGAEKKFSTCIRYSRNEAGNEQKTKYELKYDERGNVSECITYAGVGYNWEVLVGTHYTYSRVDNPTYMLGDPTDFINFMSKDLWVESNVFVSGPYVNVIPQIKRSYLIGFSGQVASVSIKEPINNVLTYHY